MDFITILIKSAFSLENNPNSFGIIGEHQYYFRVFTFSTIILMIISNILKGYKNRNASNIVHLYITPPEPIFGIWAIIYVILIAIGVYTLKHNAWTIQMYVYLIVSNLLNMIWIHIFLKNSKIAYAFCLGIAILWSFVTEQMKIQLSKLAFEEENEMFLNSIIKNGISFYQGWLLIALNLNVGIFVVYSIGISKKIQFISFWIFAPLQFIMLVHLNVKTDGNFKDSFGFFVSSIYGLIGAMITSYKYLKSKKNDFDFTLKNILFERELKIK